MPKAWIDAKDHIVQFRVDDIFMKRLQSIAGKKATPVGVLARQWVAERLIEEFEISEKFSEKWVETRYPIVHGIARNEMEKGFGLVIHLVPLVNDIDLSPEQLSYAGDLFTHSSKIMIQKGLTISGYYVQIHFNRSTKANWHTEIFSTGQIESIRLIPEIEPNVVSASAIESALVQSIFIYCRLLESVSIVPPIDIRVGLIGVENYQTRATPKDKLGNRFTHSDFRFPNTLLDSYERVESTQSTEELLSRPIQMIWNAAGLKNKIASAEGA